MDIKTSIIALKEQLFKSVKIKKILFVVFVIFSFSLVFAKEQSIEIADIVPGNLSEGEPALILGKDGTLIAQVMGDNHFKRLDMFGKVKQIGESFALSDDGTIYLWEGKYIPYVESSSELKFEVTKLKLPGHDYMMVAESNFNPISSFAIAEKNGDVFYVRKNISDLGTPNIQKIISKGSVVTAMAVLDVGDVSRESVGNKIKNAFYSNALIVVAREDKSIELAMKKMYPKPENTEFSVCRFPDTPDVVKKVFVGENGISVLLKNGKIAAHSGFECSNDASQRGKWQYYAIGTTNRFIDIDSNGFEYSALGNDHKMYICSTGYDEKGFVKGLIPSQSQLTKNEDGYCSMRKSPINNAIRIRSNGDEIDLIDSKGNFYFWSAIGDNFDFQRPPAQMNFSKYLE